MTNTIDKAKKNTRVQKKENLKTFTKIVIRNLPPTMTEEEFVQQTEPLPDYEFYYYCMADWSLGLEATCRAYLTLRNLDDVILFRNRFDGYVFVDSKSVEYIAIVEYAPFQAYHKKKSRNNDNKENTIESELHYQQYLEKLRKKRDEFTHGSDLKTEFTLERKVDDKNTSTPLLQYLASKKEKRREEAKKKSDCKRKHREDEKLKQSQQHTLKIAPIQYDDKTKYQNNMNIQNKQDYKMSRNKRRAERDRKRREEHEQKKRFREAQHRNQNLNTNNEKGITLLRKAPNDGSDHNTRDHAGEKEHSNEQMDVYKSEGKIQTVKNFNINIQGVNDDTSKIPSSVDKSNVSRPPPTYTSKKVQLQESFDDRRIKNKDRPSIAIYQPKARLRNSVESELTIESLEESNISKQNTCKRIGRRPKQNLSDRSLEQKSDTLKSK